VGQEKGPLSPTEISKSEYELEAESSTELVLLAQRSQAIPLSLTPSLSPSPPPPYKMSQPDYPAIIRQLQKQIAVLTAQVRGRAEEVKAGAGTANMDVAKLQLFDGTSSKVLGFIMGCKLYVKNKLAEATVEKQI